MTSNRNSNSRYHKNFQTGFTLIELVVVVAIVGLLATIVLFSVQRAYSEARDARRFAEVRNIVTALELYYSTYNVYPCGTLGEGVFSDPPWGTFDVDPWRESGSPFGENFMDGMVGVTNSQAACIGEPKHGLVTEGLLPPGVHAPAVSGGYYSYVYHVTQNRKGYLFTVTFESDPEAMANDPGPTNCAYEVAGGSVQILDYNYQCVED